MRIVEDNMKLVRNLEVIMARREQGEGEDVAFAQMEAFAKARQRRFDRIQAENEVRFCLFCVCGFPPCLQRAHRSSSPHLHVDPCVACMPLDISFAATLCCDLRVVVLRLGCRTVANLISVHACVHAF